MATTHSNIHVPTIIVHEKILNLFALLELTSSTIKGGGVCEGAMRDGVEATSDDCDV